jgi:hypothetical protein
MTAKVSFPRAFDLVEEDIPVHMPDTKDGCAFTNLFAYRLLEGVRIKSWEAQEQLNRFVIPNPTPFAVVPAAVDWEWSPVLALKAYRATTHPADWLRVRH